MVQEAFPTQGAPTGHSQMSVLLGRRTTAEQAHAGHLALSALRVPGTGAQAGRGCRGGVPVDRGIMSLLVSPAELRAHVAL